MVGQLLVASGVAATCGLLGVSEWLRERAWRTRAAFGRQVLFPPSPRRPADSRITPLDDLIGYRRDPSKDAELD